MKEMFTQTTVPLKQCALLPSRMHVCELIFILEAIQTTSQRVVAAE